MSRFLHFPTQPNPTQPNPTRHNILIITPQISSILSGNLPANSAVKNNKFVNHQSSAAASSNTAAVYANNGLNTNACKGYSNGSNIRNTRDIGQGVGVREAEMSISNLNTTAASVYGLKAAKGDRNQNQTQMRPDQQYNLKQTSIQQNLNVDQYNSPLQAINNDKQIISSHMHAGKGQQQGQPTPLMQQGRGHGQLQLPTQSKQQQQQQHKKFQVQPLEISSSTISSVRTSHQQAPVQQLFSTGQHASANPHSSVGHTMIRGTGTTSNGRGVRVNASGGVGNAHENNRSHENRGVKEYGDPANNSIGRVDMIHNSKAQQQQHDIRDESNGQDIQTIGGGINRRASGKVGVDRDADSPYDLTYSPEQKKQRVG